MFPTNSRVILKKQNGEIVENIPAMVQPNTIFIRDSTIPIEEGDHLIRKLKNSLEEAYLVIDRGFYGDMPGFSDHYQVKVKKVGTIELESPKQVIYNLNGNNSRVNIASTDNSHNIINITPENLFNELRSVLVSNISDRQERRDMLEIVDDLEDTQNTPTFLDKYQQFIGLASSHMGIISPFIPALTQMLS